MAPRFADVLIIASGLVCSTDIFALLSRKLHAPHPFCQIPAKEKKLFHSNLLTEINGECYYDPCSISFDALNIKDSLLRGIYYCGCVEPSQFLTIALPAVLQQPPPNIEANLSTDE